MRMCLHHFLLQASVPVGGGSTRRGGLSKTHPSGEAHVPDLEERRLRAALATQGTSRDLWVPPHEGDEIATCPAGQHFPEIHGLKNNSFSL